MGHYRLQTNGIWPGTQLDLLTISGPLELKGSGTIAAGGRLRFTGRAQAMAGTDPGVKAQLTGVYNIPLAEMPKAFAKGKDTTSYFASGEIIGQLLKAKGQITTIPATEATFNDSFVKALAK